MKVLAVGAHPDDLEILCGGTLALFLERGDEVVMCHATLGDRGSYEIESHELATIRNAEAARAAEIIGARHVSLGLRDTEVNAGASEQRHLVVELIRDTRPDFIITHAPNDYMGDHNQISQLVFECSFHATLPLYQSNRPHHDVVAPIMFMSTVSGLDFNPSEFVDISSVIDTKSAMLECHQSQLSWLEQHDGIDAVDQMRATSHFYGQQCGVAYAEAFRPCLTWPRVRPYRLLP